jgi:hypothetical protein
MMKNYYDFPAIKRASFLPPFIEKQNKNSKNDSNSINN